MTENASFTVCYESYLPVNNQPRSQGFLLPVSTERKTERPWLGLVTWLKDKTRDQT